MADRNPELQEKLGELDRELEVSLIPGPPYSSIPTFQSECMPNAICFRLRALPRPSPTHDTFIHVRVPSVHAILAIPFPCLCVRHWAICQYAIAPDPTLYSMRAANSIPVKKIAMPVTSR